MERWEGLTRTARVHPLDELDSHRVDNELDRLHMVATPQLHATHYYKYIILI